VGARSFTRRFVAVCLFAAMIGATLVAASAASARDSVPAPVVTVVRHGGLCLAGTECRSVLRIDDRTISGEGYRPRPLRPAERVALLRAISKLDRAYLRAHPFRGTCPIAYDGTESIYRFRGFPTRVASCTYELEGVAAVRLVERLLGTLKPR
jgi:hypothetical protein